MIKHTDVSKPISVEALIRWLESVKNKNLLVKVSLCREVVNSTTGEHEWFESVGKPAEGFVALASEPDEGSDGYIELCCFTGDQDKIA